MAADAIVMATFEKDSYCSTAQYGDNGDGTLSVHNYAKTGSPDGTTYTIDGYGYQTKPDTEPGQLRVVLTGGAPFPAPYWILELGPINKDGLYDYAIVSDSLSAFLFVLARDVDDYNSLYKESVSATLVKLGFTGLTAPIDTYHGEDCVYESTTRRQEIDALQKTDMEVVRGTPTTVSTLDVPAYMGYWYNVYGDKFTISTTLHNSLCNTATYVLQDDGTFSVHNSGNKKAVDGEVSSIDGYAYIQDASEPGQLKLHLDGVPTLGDYWVLATGPIVAGKYAYSIVSDPKGLSLYVLARDNDTFAKMYEADVLAILEDMGFDGAFTTPVAMHQVRNHRKVSYVSQRIRPFVTLF
jgi:lipocalin